LKILIIQIRPGIGDFCLFLPYIHEIAKQFPKYKVSILTKKRTSAKEIVKNDNYISEVFYLEDLTDKIQSSTKRFIKLIFFLRKKNFQYAFIMHRSLRWYLISKFSLISKVFIYGFFKKKVDIYLDALKNCKKWLKKEDIKSTCELRTYKKENKNQIIIGIGSSGMTRRWFTINFIELIKKISFITNNDCSFLIACGNNSSEKLISNEIIDSLKNIKIFSLCDLRIDECLNKINGSKLYIGTDSGFMHLSAALNVPTIALFGDTPLSYANYSKNIYPVIPDGYSRIGHNSLAMNKITVDQVFKKYLELSKNFF